MTTQRAISPVRIDLDLANPEATEALGEGLARRLRAGDTILLSGPIGAGKSHLARAAIRAAMALNDAPPEDIPSPTYTLVQIYPAGDTEVWHADLYRLTDPAEVFELGLDDAFGTAICLVEWPDRLGSAAPPDALTVTLSDSGDGRHAILTGPEHRWGNRLRSLAADFGAPHAPAR